MRDLRALRAWTVVVGMSTCFGVLAGIVTWTGATQRRAAWVAATPQMYEERAAWLARIRLRVPDLTSDLDLHTMRDSVPAPGQVLEALGAQVLVQTLFFAAACALMVVPNLGGRPIWASLVPAAMIGGVALSAGPLAFLPGTLGGPLTPTPQPGISFVHFAAPVWWHLIVAAIAAVPFIGAWLLTRPPRRRQTVELRKALGALALFVLVVEITVLLLPQTLVPAGTAVSAALPTAAVLLVLGCCAAVAGSAGTVRRGAVTAVVVGLVGGTAWIAAWIVYRSGNSPEIFGWEQAPGEPILWLGTRQLITLVLAAGGIGWTARAALQALTVHRPSGLTMFVPPATDGGRG